ncbi:unnamed protein product [Prorocentrum cordatum]|uniref:Uncharacterized protein n=1 Tax=Prorocentrum cordatum TaxID=2364126 RepID=A0ABN9Y085_9DINO|nr:unnamed protein product [Polarella glacialis]
MFDMMANMQERMNEMKETAQIASDTAGRALAEVVNVQSDVERVKADMKSLRAELPQLVQGIVAGAPPPTTPAQDDNIKAISRGIRELQVIAKGLKEDQDEDAVIKQVRDTVKQLGAEAKVEQGFVFSDPSGVGAIEFKTIASKIGFLKKQGFLISSELMATTCISRTATACRNEPSTKHLRQVKHQFQETSHDLKSMKIKWGEDLVKLAGDTVAWYEGSEMKYKGKGLKVKAGVEEYMSRAHGPTRLVPEKK